MVCARDLECHVVPAIIRKSTDDGWPQPEGSRTYMVQKIRIVKFIRCVERGGGIVYVVTGVFQIEQHLVLLRMPSWSDVHSVERCGEDAIFHLLGIVPDHAIRKLELQEER